MASMLSQFEGKLSQTDVDRVQSILSKANLPTSISKAIKSEKLIQAMSVDKKAVDGNLRLVLLNSLGDSFVTGSYAKENLQKVISNFC